MEIWEIGALHYTSVFYTPIPLYFHTPLPNCRMRDLIPITVIFENFGYK
jgi:hypothetical protein